MVKYWRRTHSLLSVLQIFCWQFSGVSTGPVLNDLPKAAVSSFRSTPSFRLNVAVDSFTHYWHGNSTAAQASSFFSLSSGQCLFSCNKSTTG